MSVRTPTISCEGLEELDSPMTIKSRLPKNFDGGVDNNSSSIEPVEESSSEVLVIKLTLLTNYILRSRFPYLARVPSATFTEASNNGLFNEASNMTVHRFLCHN